MTQSPPLTHNGNSSSVEETVQEIPGWVGRPHMHQRWSPSRTEIFPIDFKCVEGQWKCKSRNDAAATLAIKDADGVQRILTRCDLGKTQEMLGVFMTMNGNWTAQKEVLKEKVLAFLKTNWRLHKWMEKKVALQFPNSPFPHFDRVVD